ncbi:hypothetical protein VPH35_080644 [Triticum aestivum]
MAAANGDSASILCATTPTMRHMMKIQGYSWMRKSNPNSFYPSGTTPETTGFVSVKAVLDAAIKAVVEFDMLDHHANPVPRYARTSGEVRDLVGADAYWSCDDLVERADLERHLLKDDCFTVIEGVVVPPSDWPHHFRGLLRSGEGADVRFRVGGETFAAHGHLLHFVYTDSLPEEEEEGDGVAMAQHLMEAADRYGMERLKLVNFARIDCAGTCSGGFFEKLYSIGKMIRYWAAHGREHRGNHAEQHHCQGLKDACFDLLINSPTKLDEAMATCLQKLPCSVEGVDVQARRPLFYSHSQGSALVCLPTRSTKTSKHKKRKLC